MVVVLRTSYSYTINRWTSLDIDIKRVNHKCVEILEYNYWQELHLVKINIMKSCTRKRILQQNQGYIMNNLENCFKLFQKSFSVSSTSCPQNKRMAPTINIDITLWRPRGRLSELVESLLMKAIDSWQITFRSLYHYFLIGLSNGKCFWLEYCAPSTKDFTSRVPWCSRMSALSGSWLFAQLQGGYEGGGAHALPAIELQKIIKRWKRGERWGEKETEDEII